MVSGMNTKEEKQKVHWPELIPTVQLNLIIIPNNSDPVVGGKQMEEVVLHGAGVLKLIN